MGTPIDPKCSPDQGNSHERPFGVKSHEALIVCPAGGFPKILGHLLSWRGSPHDHCSIVFLRSVLESMYLGKLPCSHQIINLSELA